MNKQEAHALTVEAQAAAAIAAEEYRLRVIEEGEIAFNGHMVETYAQIASVARQGFFVCRVVISGSQAWGRIAQKLREDGYQVITGTLGTADKLTYSYDIAWN